MGLRAFLNGKPVLAAVAGGLMVAVAVGSMVHYMNNVGPHRITQVYFSTDDGKTWFADSVEKIPPFDHDGQEADRVYLYHAASGTPFIAYLQRYTKAGKREAEKLWADAHAKADAAGGRVEVDQIALDGLTMNSAEVKKPGGTQWYQTSKAPAAVMRLDCPPGTDLGTVTQYLP